MDANRQLLKSNILEIKKSNRLKADCPRDGKLNQIEAEVRSAKAYEPPFSLNLVFECNFRCTINNRRKVVAGEHQKRLLILHRKCYFIFAR
jgi:hypothetical protein